MKLIDLTGRRFGNITVLERVYDPTKKNSTFWRCICDCGTELFDWGPAIRGCKTRRGKTKCASCRNTEFRDRGIAKRSPDTLIRCLTERYLSRAKQKGLKFSLSFDEVKQLISGNCFYCGSAPFAIYRKHSQSLRYSGIDRRDNTRGYEIENTVSCCKWCNQAKMDRSQEDFVAWLKRAYSCLT